LGSGSERTGKSLRVDLVRENVRVDVQLSECMKKNIIPFMRNDSVTALSKTDLQRIKIKNKDPKRVFNADEAAFFLNPKGNKVLFSRGEKCVYSIVNNDEKECLTVMVCGEDTSRYR
jgi:hypothetical protein